MQQHIPFGQTLFFSSHMLYERPQRISTIKAIKRELSSEYRNVQMAPQRILYEAAEKKCKQTIRDAKNAWKEANINNITINNE